MLALLQFLAMVKEMRRTHPLLLVAHLLNNYGKMRTHEQEDDLSFLRLHGKRAQGCHGRHSWMSSIFGRRFLAERPLRMMKQKTEVL